ncbi:hypothetical protein [Luedemannella flava]
MARRGPAGAYGDRRAPADLVGAPAFLVSPPADHVDSGWLAQ